jgi:LPXTG-motif cell wall-anchored protein
MLRPRPLVPIIAAFALLAGALVFAPVAATQSGESTLSPTPPVKLAPASSATPTTTTSTPPEQLPKTGLDVVLITAAGLVLLGSGVALRRGLTGPASRGSG